MLFARWRTEQLGLGSYVLVVLMVSGAGVNQMGCPCIKTLMRDYNEERHELMRLQRRRPEI
jgi:hypothetical protein